jgi:hypothetical protein
MLQECFKITNPYQMPAKAFEREITGSLDDTNNLFKKFMLEPQSSKP